MLVLVVGRAVCEEESTSTEASLFSSSPDYGTAPPYESGEPEGPSLGFILGHEIMHSLDHSGRGFDLQGKLALVWDQSSLVR